MVVCKCRKATKLYCFVHKVPVCGECICFPEHQICVVRTYSEWVIDGEYDWPPRCCLCHAGIEVQNDSQTTRLGCLHIIHSNCLVSHIKGFPPHTAPAGYVCPSCSTPMWPPKIIKDSGSRFHSKLKEAIMQSGLEKNLFGNHPVSLAATELRIPPPAFSSDPLIQVSTSGGISSTVGKDAEGHSDANALGSNDIEEIDGPGSENPYLPNQQLNFTKGSTSAGTTQPGATTRKSAFQLDRQSSETSYYADDEDAKRKKYTRRGTLRHKFLRSLLPFWTSALPTLPVTTAPRRETVNADDVPEGHVRHQRPTRMDPRKILLVIAIMACMATMGILYYRIAQRGLGEDSPDDELQ